jgi:hypothetical protein
MKNSQLSAKQHEVCRRFEADFFPTDPESKVGVAENVRAGILPLNGLRHPETEGTSGWYLWAGETLSEDDDFFKPLHAKHLSDWCPQVQKYLALPPGWRFLVADGYEDVWFDETLLAI